MLGLVFRDKDDINSFNDKKIENLYLLNHRECKLRYKDALSSGCSRQMDELLRPMSSPSGCSRSRMQSSWDERCAGCSASKLPGVHHDLRGHAQHVSHLAPN